MRARPPGCLALTALLLAGCATAPLPSPLKREPVPPSAMMKERFPDHLRVAYSDAGDWLVPWLLHYWAHADDPAPHLARLNDLKADGLTTEEALLVLLPGLGLWTHASYANLPQVRDRVAAGCPVVVQLAAGSGRQRGRRFAIVTAAPASGALTVLYDDGREVALSEVDFVTAWRPVRYWMLTASPPERATWPMRSGERVNLIRFMDRAGQSARADAIGEEALARDPNNPDLLASLGLRAWSRGRPADAERLLRRALALNPRHVRAANNLSWMLAEQGRALEEADELARRAVLLEPSNPRLLDTQGFVLMKQGRHAEAVPVLERAWHRARTLSPETRIEIGVRLAQAYAKSGQHDRVPQLLVPLRQLNPALVIPEDLQPHDTTPGGPME
jgi:tetratricopeptide (TPR) repeat protein